MAADISTSGDRVTAGEPHRLFRVPLKPSRFFAPYDVAPDGQRFLLNVPDAPESLFFLTGIRTLFDRAR